MAGGSSGYRLINLPDDSIWAIRLGPADGRYLHLHPARRSPHAMDPAAANDARRRYLGFPPVREIVPTAGLGAVIALIQEVKE